MLGPKPGDKLGRQRFLGDSFFCAVGGDIGTRTVRMPVASQQVTGAIGKLQIINQVSKIINQVPK